LPSDFPSKTMQAFLFYAYRKPHSSYPPFSDKHSTFNVHYFRLNHPTTQSNTIDSQSPSYFYSIQSTRTSLRQDFTRIWVMCWASARPLPLRWRMWAP
jgi:hypothetical protein